jgi:Fic family protein
VAQVEFPIHKTKLLDSVRGGINERQEKVLLRMFAAGGDGFKGGLSAKNHAAITGAASATVTRDLSDLVTKEALIREGERKATRYHLNMTFRRSR